MVKLWETDAIAMPAYVCGSVSMTSMLTAELIARKREREERDKDNVRTIAMKI